VSKKNKKASNRRALERVTMPPGDSQILVELPSGEERLEPLLDLSPRGVAILVRAQRTGLRIGAVLPRVRFFTNGECTLQSRATIRDLTEVTLDDGSTGTKIGLRLESDLSMRSDPVTYEYTQAPIVNDAVSNLVHARSTASLERDGDTGDATLAFTRASDDKSSITLRLTAGDPPQLRRGQDVRLTTELYGTRMALSVGYRERRGDLVKFDWPRLVCVWKHRGGGRVKSLNSPFEVEVESPFVNGRLVREVADISPRGLAFVAHPADGILVGMLLRAISLSLGDGPLQAHGVVRNVRLDADGRHIVGVELTDLSENTKKRLAALVDTHFHPEVREARTKDLRHLWPIYDAMGVFPRTHAAISPVMGRIETTRQTLLSRGRNVFLQMVGGAHGELHGTAELLRSFGTTWGLQHVGTIPEAQLDADQIVTTLVQTAQRRSDFTHLHALLDPARSRDQLARLRALEPSPNDLVVRDRVLLTDGERYRLPKSLNEDMHDAQNTDLDWIAARLRDRLEPLAVVALRLFPAELRLDDTDRAFHTIGLGRRRAMRMAMSVSGPIGFSLIEQSSPGVNFAGLADLVRPVVTVTATEAHNSALTALAHDAVRVQRASGRRHAWLLVEPEEVEILTGGGFDVVGPRVEVFASRDGAGQVINCLNLLS